MLMHLNVLQASGEAPSDRYEPAEQPGVLKRPAPSAADQNPQAQKRARRLFGALMGTLAKARCRHAAVEQASAGSGRTAAQSAAHQRMVSGHVLDSSSS
jgi:hypothetical protein